MKIHRFYHSIPQKEKGVVLLKDKDLVSQIRRVLKLVPKEKIEIFDGTGLSALCTIDSFTKDGIHVFVDQVTQENDIEKQITLYLAVLKKEHFEMVVQKATEIGVSTIIPVITSRTVKLGLNMNRLHKIATEASEQSGRVTVPEIKDSLTFYEALKNMPTFDRILFCDPRGDLYTPKESSTIAVFIGPEGGWSDDEIEHAHTIGAEYITFNTPVLRAETAAIIGTYIATL